MRRAKIQNVFLLSVLFQTPVAMNEKYAEPLEVINERTRKYEIANRMLVFFSSFHLILGNNKTLKAYELVCCF